MNCTQRTIKKLRELWRQRKTAPPKKTARDHRPRYNRQLQRGRKSGSVDRGK